MSRILRDKKSHIKKNSLGVRSQYIEVLAAPHPNPSPVILIMLYAQNYNADFEKKLLGHINAIVGIIDQRLLPCCAIEENKVFYYKMLADYFRYSTDFYGENAQTEYLNSVSESLANYRYAMELGTRHLEATSPIFLSVVLNYSVFMYDMQNNVAEAILIAETAFTEAIKNTHLLEEGDHKESTLLLQLIRDNLQLWKHAAAMDEVGESMDGGGLTQQDPEVEAEA